MKFLLLIVAVLAMIDPIFGQFSSSTGGSLSSSSPATSVPSSSSSVPALSPKPLRPEQVNDLAVLNTALAVAHLESSFFACQLTTLRPLYDFCAQASSQVNFSAADFATLGYNQSVYEAFELTAYQSIEHVAALTGLITALTNNASAAVRACADYNYQRTGSVPPSQNQTLPVFFAGAQALSASSTQIHLGALTSLTDPQLLETISGLAAVEARHTSYFWQMAGFAPFSVAGFDFPVTMIQAGLVLRSWTLSCPGVTLATPTIRPYGIALNTANVTTPGYAQGDVYTGPLSAANNITYTPEQRSNDVLALDYMLFIEKVFQGLLNESNTQFNLSSWTTAGFNESIWGLIATINVNEDAHASVLRSMLVLYDDASLTRNHQCVYNFSSLLVNPRTFVQALASLKQWSASAYAGVSSSLTDTGLQQLTGQITTVEARHSAILNLIAAGNTNLPLTLVAQSTAFPTAIDPALTPAQAYDQLRALGLVVSCNANLTLPVRAPFVIPVPQDPFSSSSSSTGGFFNQSSSSGAFVNQTSSSGAFGNQTSSTGAVGNFSSSTGVIGNFTSSTGLIGNSSSSTGIIGNVSSSTGAFFNQSSSSGAFLNESSTGSVGNFSSTGSVGNFSSSTGAFGNFSSTGSFNQTTGLSTSVPSNVSSSTGRANATSSSSSSAPITGLSSSIRSSSSAAASSSSARASSSIGAPSSSTAGFTSSPTFVVSSSSSARASSSSVNPSQSSSSIVAGLTSSPLFPDSSSSTADFDPSSSSSGDGIEDPGLNGAASLTQSLSMLFALIIAVGVNMI